MKRAKRRRKPSVPVGLKRASERRNHERQATSKYEDTVRAIASEPEWVWV